MTCASPVTHLRHRLERARADCVTPEDYRQALENRDRFGG